MKNSGLGKGLSALISDSSVLKQDSSYIPKLPINEIRPNPQQPIIEIKPESIVDLADSIREHGVIEPLLVKQAKEGGYELIVGERRLKAAKLAGLEFIPAIVKDTTPEQMLEIALVENIQRSDLNALEEALAFSQLKKLYKLSHTQISKRIGISRPAVVNKIRLLKLPDNVKKGLLEGKITEGHARALLGLSTQEQISMLYAKAIASKMSVRDVEETVRRIIANSDDEVVKKRKTHDKLTIKYELTLRKSLGVNVRITKSKRGGSIIIPYKTEAELAKFYKILT